jgi:hypothetical protein
MIVMLSKSYHFRIAALSSHLTPDCQHARCLQAWHNKIIYSGSDQFTAIGSEKSRYHHELINCTRIPAP